MYPHVVHERELIGPLRVKSRCVCKLAIGSNGVGVTWVRVVGFRVTGVRAVWFPR